MLTYLQSLQTNLKDIMSADERVFFFGEDILDPYGGAFKVSQGLSSLFPDRVITTPISEAAMIGVANGMALRGLRPVVEIMFGDFITLATDQIVNYTTKFRQMYHHQVSLPIVIRTPMGGGRSYGPTHSQSLEKLFLGVPNLKIAAPSHLHNPGSLLAHCILQDDDPVLFIEHKLLYSMPLLNEVNDTFSIETIEEISGYPTMVCHNFRENKADVTIISYGGNSRLIIPLMQKLIDEEIRITACFPSILQPLPKSTLARYAAGSGRVVIVEEGTSPYNWGSEVAAILYEVLWKKIQTPIKRIAALDSVIPAAQILEASVLPSIEKIEQAILEVML